MGTPAGPGGRRLNPEAGRTDSGDYLVLLIGHPRPGSRTHVVAARAGELLRQSLAAEQISFPEPVVVDNAAGRRVGPWCDWAAGRRWGIAARGP